MIKVIKGNVLEAPIIYICHQVDTTGLAEKTIVKQIEANWPQIYYEYRSECLYNPKEELMGSILVSPINENVKFIHMFSRNDHNSNKRQTDYEYFEKCLNEIAKLIENKETTIIRFPYGIGCGTAGGDWGIIQNLIQKVLGDYNVEFYLFDPNSIDI